MTRPNVKPKQSLGQNFLTDPNTADNIAKAINPQPDDILLEIGPGMGMITERLVPKVKKYIAVEIDQRLSDQLLERFSGYDHFELIHQDFLKFDLSQFGDEKIRIVGNIPYNITSPIYFKVLEEGTNVIDLIMLIQKEVALRVAALSGTKDYSILSVMSQAFAEVELFFHVPGSVFTPPPKIESSLVHWTFTDKLSQNIRDRKLFKTIVKQAFGQRRKMLRNPLKSYYKSHPDAVDYTLRPEQLSIQAWIDFANKLAE